MPKDERIKKVLVIGSGPIIIGQAAEFDYAGTQACRTLQEEGVEVVLVNSNPATIMTDPAMADKVYLEPLTLPSLEAVLRKERPDALLPTLGGQIGLNLAMELGESGILKELSVRLLGTSLETIYRSEDREGFKSTMEEIGEPCIESVVVHQTSAALDFADRIGYPVIVRPAYTLGGTGGGIAETPEKLSRVCEDGLRASRVGQTLVEKCIAGWKEIEFEVIRDHKDNCITVCSMENVDPVGIHTGDSIVVAPAQTLRDPEYQMLRSAAIHIIRSLKIEGGCNVQFALDPASMEYYVIEVNPRLSRSSALASKATGYPIARVATRIALGYGLDEIPNAVTGNTTACFEPSMDYVVVKFPRWPFDKFTHAEKTLGTRMKATGEAMAIGACFEMAFLKAVRSLELDLASTEYRNAADYSDNDLVTLLHKQTDERIFVVLEALRRGVTPADIHTITKIDSWYLYKLQRIVLAEEDLKRQGTDYLTPANMRAMKRMGFGDRAIAAAIGISEERIRALRKEMGILPTFKMVDTCSAEFDAVTPYYYSTYDSENESLPSGRPTVVVLGSGPIRIGQGVEFDYCSVHAVWALKKMGFDTVIINNNPETVSTDFDIADRLYFEPLTTEEIGDILDIEHPIGVLVQFGGQTAIKLAKSVKAMGYKILGTSLRDIDAAEDRELFDTLLESLGIARPKGGTVYTEKNAVIEAGRLGYPVLVRPSYVLGGQGMQIAHNEGELRSYMAEITRYGRPEHPVLVDSYLPGKEIEVDALCDGNQVLIPGIMEHIERAGIHSGDSISVYPSRTLSPEMIERIVEVTTRLAQSLCVKGMINIQYIVYRGNLYVIEVNPRSSRTVPYISKVTGIPLVEIAVRCAMGQTLAIQGYTPGLQPTRGIYAVKVPVFSFEKLPDLEVALGPEMKSTGETLGMDPDFFMALLKGLDAAGIRVQPGDSVLFSCDGRENTLLAKTAAIYQSLGCPLYATPGTADNLRAAGIGSIELSFVDEDDSVRSHIRKGEIGLIVNTPTTGQHPSHQGFALRRLAVESQIPCLTSLDTALAFGIALKARENKPFTPLNLGGIR
ncbi:MAG: carbamoyl-phosphate synthase large subunit [Christensenellales bacterium]|jgi:carbamoyl-phosphate synthase large subunit